MPAGVGRAPVERPPAAGEQRVEVGADGGVVGHDQLAPPGSACRRGRRRRDRRAACPARGRSPRRPVSRHSATARHRPSSENASRSSTLPPPRASTITSTSGSASSAAQRRAITAAARPPPARPPRRSGSARPDARSARLDDVALGGGVAAAHEPDDTRAGAAAAACARRRRGPPRPAAAAPPRSGAAAGRGRTARSRYARKRNSPLRCHSSPRPKACTRSPAAGGGWILSKRSRCIEPCRIAAVVLEAEVDEPPPVGALELRELALDPDVAEPAQPVGHALVEPGHGVDGTVAVGRRRRLRVHNRSLGWLIGNSARLDVRLWVRGSVRGGAACCEPSHRCSPGSRP